MREGWLVLEHATGRRFFHLARDRMTVGSDPKNDVRIDDPSVSDLHAVIVRSPGGFSLIDAGSGSAATVNGISAPVRPLEEGDRVRLGDARLVFLAHAPQLEPPRRIMLRKAAASRPVLRRWPIALAAGAGFLLTAGILLTLTLSRPDPEPVAWASEPPILKPLSSPGAEIPPPPAPPNAVELNSRSEDLLVIRPLDDLLAMVDRPDPEPPEPPKRAEEPPPEPRRESPPAPPPPVEAKPPEPPPAPEPRPQPRKLSYIEFREIEKSARDAIDTYVLPKFEVEPAKAAILRVAEVNSHESVDLCFKILSDLERARAELKSKAKAIEQWLQNPPSAASESILRQRDLQEKKLAIYRRDLVHLAEVEPVVVRALGEFTSDEALERLLQKARLSKEVRVRSEAAGALEKGGSDRHISAIASWIDGEKEEEIREKLVRAVGRIARPNELLIKVLCAEARARSNPASLRQQALDALGAIGSKRAVPSLIDLLKDPEWGAQTHRVLCRIAGTDIEGSVSAWKAWYEKNKL
jgi:outer membrane biosynthesis protein TonB